MFRKEALQELQRQFNKEGGKFTPQILWVDDDGVSQDKLAAFSQAAQAEVTVVNNPNQAVVKWQMSGYVGLIVDHNLGSKTTGSDVIKEIIQTGILPYYVAIVTTGIPWLKRRQYPSFITGKDIFNKDQPYDQIGLRFRHMLEDGMIAAGQHPEQRHALDQIRPHQP